MGGGGDCRQAPKKPFNNFCAFVGQIRHFGKNNPQTRFQKVQYPVFLKYQLWVWVRKKNVSDKSILNSLKLYYPKSVLFAAS